MKMSDKLRKYEQLNEMLNIPEIDKIICTTVSQLYEKYRDHIRDYLRQKERYGISGGGDAPRQDKPPHKAPGKGQEYFPTGAGNGVPLRILDGQDPDRPVQAYGFELHRFEDKSEADGFRWCITNLLPMPDININKVLPRDIINFIGLQAPGPGEEKVELDFFSLEEKAYFSFFYTKYSAVHAFGRIRRRQTFAVREDPAAGEFPAGDNIIYMGRSREETGEQRPVGSVVEDDYREMFYYMKKFPEIKEHLFSEFFNRCKPFFKSKLVDIISG